MVGSWLELGWLGNVVRGSRSTDCLLGWRSSGTPWERCNPPGN